MNKLQNIIIAYLSQYDFSDFDIDDFHFQRMISNIPYDSLRSIKNDSLQKLLNNSGEFRTIYQEKTYLKVVESIKKKDNLLISAPTRFGKSYISRRIAVDRRNKGLRTFIIVPTNEVARDYSNKLNKEHNSTCENFVCKDNKQENVFVLTPERFINYYKDDSKSLKKTDVMIIYEVNKLDFISKNVVKGKLKESVIKIKNSANLQREQALLDSIRLALSKKVTLIGFMPMYSIEKNEEVFEFLSGVFNKLYNVYFEPTNREVYAFNGLSTGVATLKQNPKSAYPVYKDLKKIRFSDFIGHKTIFYVSRRDVINISSNVKIVLRLLPDVKIDGYLKIYLDRLKEYYSEVFHKTNPYIVAAKKGVGIIIEDTPSFIRMHAEDLYNNGDIKYLLGNKALIEGLHLSADYLIVLDTKTSPFSTSDEDVSNLLGRTGRGNEGDDQAKVFLVGASENMKNKWMNIAMKKNEVDMDKRDSFKFDNSKNNEMKSELESFREKVSEALFSNDSDNDIPMALNSVAENWSKQNNSEVEIEVKRDKEQVLKEISQKVTTFIKERIIVKQDYADLGQELYLMVCTELLNAYFTVRQRPAIRKYIDSKGTRREFKAQTSLDKYTTIISRHEGEAYENEFQYAIHNSIWYLFNYTIPEIIEVVLQEN